MIRVSCINTTFPIVIPSRGGDVCTRSVAAALLPLCAVALRLLLAKLIAAITPKQIQRKRKEKYGARQGAAAYTNNRYIIIT